MAYTREWDETYPQGTLQADSLDDLIREVKVDLRERFLDLFGMTLAQFVADPIQPQKITLADDISAKGGFRQVVGGWSQSDIPAGQAALEATRTEGRYVATRGGSITGVVATLAAGEARTTGSLTVTVWTATINPATGVRTETATTLSAVIDATNAVQKITTVAKDTIPITAGTEVFVKVTTDAGWGPVTNDVAVSVELEG